MGKQDIVTYRPDNIGGNNNQNVIQKWLADRRKRQQEEEREKNDQKINEEALRAMSDIGHELRNVVDSDEFRKKESSNGRYSNILSRNGQRVLTVSVERDEDGKANNVEVHDDPVNSENGDPRKGYWRIHSVKDGGEIRWMSSAIYGPRFFEGYDIIQELSVSQYGSCLHLKKVDFGGYPDISVWLNAWGEKGGPIGNIREITVLGLAIAAKPVKDHIMDSDIEMIPIDASFTVGGKLLEFSRGDAGFAVQRRFDESGRKVLRLKYFGVRKRRATHDDDRTNLGPESKEFEIPEDMVDGRKIIGLFAGAVGELKSMAIGSP